VQAGIERAVALRAFGLRLTASRWRIALVAYGSEDWGFESLRAARSSEVGLE